MTSSGTAEALRWGILGTGRISESFVPDIREAGGHVSAVWGRTPARAEEFGARSGIECAVADLDELLHRSDIDVVYVATPPATHVDLAVRALEAGKHVVVEKPVATSAADAERLFAVATAHDRFAMEAMWMKFNPLHRDVAARVADGVLGVPRSVRAAFGMPFPAGGSRWSSELGGSTVLDQGVYPVVLAEWLLGPVDGVGASGSVRDGVDVAASITLRHRGGGTSQLACSMLEFADPSASVSGTKGWLEIPAMFWAGGEALLHAGSPEALFGAPIPISHPREGNGYVPMIRSVQGSIARGERQHPDHDAHATVTTARVLEQIRDQIHEEVVA